METTVWPNGGLSPRLWGNPCHRPEMLVMPGSIPTPVGEPQGADRKRLGIRVYPHACGGTGAGELAERLMPGLSPRLWGNPAWTTTPMGMNGSIPTPVGEPLFGHWRRGNGGVYPHACGGTDGQSRRQGPWWGLSPRLWGNPVYGAFHEECIGSIPTPVGEPGYRLHSPAFGGVYPHACGGTFGVELFDRAAQGLSPRLWGNQRA